MKNALRIKREEAKAWIRKYLIAASAFRGDLLSIRIAKTAIVLISRPIHAINQEGADIAVTDPKINNRMNKVFQGRENIKRRRFSIFGI